MTRVERLVRDEQGIALLEFALLATLLLLIAFGTIDFGRRIFTQTSLTSAVREGARYGAALPSDPCANPWQDSIKRRVVSSHTNYWNPSADSLTAAMITVNCPSSGGTVQRVEVTATYTKFRWLTPIMNLLNNQQQPKPATAKATFRWESS